MVLIILIIIIINPGLDLHIRRADSLPAADSTTVGATAITTPTLTITEAAATTTTTTKPLSWQNKLRDSRGRFISNTASN